MPRPLPDFQTLFESAPGRYLVVGLDFRIVAASEAYLRAACMTRPEVMGRSIFTLYDRADQPSDAGRALRISLERVRSGGLVDAMAPQIYELRRPRPPRRSERRHWRTVHSPVFGAEGRLSYIVHTVEDVTAFERLHEAAMQHDRPAAELHARAARLERELLLRTKELQRSNGELARLLDAQAPAHGGAARWWSSAARSAGAPALPSPQARDTPGPVLARLRNAVDARLANDQAPRLLAELQRKHEAVLQLSARLASTKQEFDAFSSTLAHELRAPLRSLEGFSQLLSDDLEPQLDARSRDYLTRIRAAAQRMGQTLDDLLRLARAEQAELVRERVDVSALASAVAAELAEANPGRAVRFEVQENLFAVADVRLLRIVLENLLGNAWKFTGRTAEPHVRCGVRLEGGRVTFFVRDNGAGFDMAAAKELFAAFARLHDHAEFAGTGIGLVTARRIIERHGGRIWAESRPLGGAAFFWTLPNHEAAMTGPHRTSPDHAHLRQRPDDTTAA